MIKTLLFEKDNICWTWIKCWEIGNSRFLLWKKKYIGRNYEEKNKFQ